MRDVAVIEFGMAQQEFWQLTPADYDGLFAQHVKREERANRRAALIAMYIANFAGKMIPTDAPKLTVADILGQHAQPESEMERLRRQTADPVGDYVERLKASNPNDEIILSQAILDASAGGFGTWSKLGPGNRAMQPVSIAKAMNPGWRTPQ
jgi:hypothetical protein